MMSSLKLLRQYIDPVLNSYSDVYFIRNTYIGFFILLTSLINYNVFLMGLLSLVSAILFGVFIGVSRESLKSGFLTYNALLVGCSIGYAFHISPLTIFFVMASGIFTLFISIMLNSIFYYYLKLPIFSLPFIFVSSMAYMASFRYSNLFVSEFYHNKSLGSLDLPYWLAGFFKSLGAVLFLPFSIIGLLFSLLILIHSRILFFLAVSGYFLGTAVSAMMEGSVYQAHADLNNYNYILIAMAIGGVFLVPSPRSYVIAAVAVVISTILVDAGAFLWSGYGILTFSPMPFNIVALCFLYVLNLSDFRLVAPRIRRTPEATLDDYLSNVERFDNNAVRIGLPFSGKWTVWQAFDGQWTHKGSWRHAYDFVITKEGENCRGDGTQLSDYYCFRKPVFSPVRGRIVKVVNDIADNVIGTVNRDQNWGNLVIIETPDKYFVELSHFAQNSIRVEEGAWVETQTLLGLCGNSGFSPEPHIHIQVQLTAEVGAPTHPFQFSGHIENNMFQPGGLPAKDTVIESILPDSSLDERLGFTLDTSKVYALTVPGKSVENIQVKIENNDVGEMFFSTGQGKLYFAKSSHSFYFYRMEGHDILLSTMFLTSPRIPLYYRRDLAWQDNPPLMLALTGWKAWGMNFVRSFCHRIGKLHYSATWISENSFDGSVTSALLERDISFSVVLDKRHGLSKVRAGEVTIQYVS